MSVSAPHNAFMILEKLNKTYVKNKNKNYKRYNSVDNSEAIKVNM